MVASKQSLQTRSWQWVYPCKSIHKGLIHVAEWWLFTTGTSVAGCFIRQEQIKFGFFFKLEVLWHLMAKKGLSLVFSEEGGVIYWNKSHRNVQKKNFTNFYFAKTAI